MTEINQHSPQRCGWIDVMRIVACAMVVLSHCCDGFVAQFDTDYSAFLWGTGIGSLMRSCVPLFVMMSGVLLLPMPAEQPVNAFYKKRMGRLIWPLIFWSLALPVVCYLYFTTIGAASVNPSVDLSVYTPEGLTNRLWTWVLNFNFDTTPLWYLYMLLGLYFIIPVMNAWLNAASKKDVETVLTVWIITLFLPYLKLFAPLIGYQGNYGNFDILGGCDWNLYSTFYYVSGFAGYLLFAHYLKRWPTKVSNAVLAISFLVGYAITFGGFVAIQEVHPGDYAFLEIVWYFTGINVWMMTIPIFIWGQRLNFKSSKTLETIAGLTFGIYLCHFCFVLIGYDLYANSSMPALLRILLNAITAFAVSAALTRLMSLCRFTARFVK